MRSVGAGFSTRNRITANFPNTYLKNTRRLPLADQLHFASLISQAKSKEPDYESFNYYDQIAAILTPRDERDFPKRLEGIMGVVPLLERIKIQPLEDQDPLVCRVVAHAEPLEHSAVRLAIPGHKPILQVVETGKFINILKGLANKQKQKSPLFYESNNNPKFQLFVSFQPHSKPNHLNLLGYQAEIDPFTGEIKNVQEHDGLNDEMRDCTNPKIYQFFQKAIYLRYYNDVIKGIIDPV